MNKTIALIGNPNSGKTLLFNSLTGARAKVGNFAGVTTEQKSGVYKKDGNITFVDLPGIYDMQSKSKDERVTKEYLEKNNVSAIINVVDGTNLERNLYLTVSLTELKIPVVIAINFCDKLKRQGVKINLEKIEKAFGVKVVLISALKNINVDKLVKLATAHYEIPVDLTKNYFTPQKTYKFIEELVSASLTVVQRKENKLLSFIDSLLIGKYTAIPIFAIMLIIVFYLTNKVGSIFEGGISFLQDAVIGSFKYSTNTILGILAEVFVNGVLKGIFTVFSFLPHVLTLFIFLSVLEDSGYMSRVAFVFDGLLNKFNVSGKSVIPFMLCTGCTASGILGSRIIDSVCERKKCITLSPLIPCGAKNIVFAYFSSKFFNSSPLLSVSLYFLSIFAIVIFAKVFNNKSENGSSEFLLEIPPLRCPAIKNVKAVLVEKVKDFFIRVAPVIFISSVVMSFLLTFGFAGYVGSNIEQSFLYYLGSGISYFFKPLGFGNWQSAVALIVGSFAKEGIVGALEIIGYENLFASNFATYSFLVFITFSPPCIASIMTAKEELPTKKDFYKMVFFQFGLAYFCSLIINFIGVIFIYEKRLLFIILICIIPLLSIIYFIKAVKIKVKKGGEWQ